MALNTVENIFAGYFRLLWGARFDKKYFHNTDCPAMDGGRSAVRTNPVNRGRLRHLEERV